MGFQASLSGYLTSEGRGASGPEPRKGEGPDACQPCRCLLKINQLYVGSKPLISEQENGLAIKLERGRIHCFISLYIPGLLHFCPHLYLSVSQQASPASDTDTVFYCLIEVVLSCPSYQHKYSEP